MKKILRLLIIIIGVSSCSDNKPEKQSLSSENTTKNKIEKNERKAPNNDVINNSAFIKLVNYDYRDYDDYGESNDRRTITLKGETNLPDETNITVNVGGFVPSTKEENASDTYDNVEVSNGKFELTLKPWNIPQTLSFSVFKDDQPSQVLEIVGEFGDKMKILDKNKHEFPSICFFRDELEVNTERISTLKSGKSIEYKFQTHKDFTHPAEKALAKFINAWKEKKWSEMVKHTQQSQGETTENLESMFGNVEVLGFEILNSSKNSDEFVKDWYSVEYKLNIKPVIAHKGIQTKKIKANIINENGYYGVNASSATSGLYN